MERDCLMGGRPPPVVVALLAGLMTGAGHAGEPPGPAAGATVTLDGVACHYPAHATRLADPGEAGPIAWAVDFTCENQTPHAVPDFAPPRLSLVDAAGREYTADPALPRSDPREAAALPAGGRFAGTAVFHPPPDAPPGPWQLQVRTPNRSILLPLHSPPTHP